MPLSDDVARGAGLKSFLAGEDDVPLFEARQITFTRISPGT
jgi:protein involved in temperature-dependent protein secretion